LLANLLQAGYLEDWRYHATLSGSPQGGVISPILSNVYLDRLDQFAETVLLPAYNHGDRRKPYPPYMALLNAARRQWDAGHPDEARQLRQQAQRMASRDPDDPDFRRLWYVRYADDILLGFSGPWEEAEQIKQQLQGFFHETFMLDLSQDKTMITYASTEVAHHIGY